MGPADREREAWGEEAGPSGSARSISAIEVRQRCVFPLPARPMTNRTGTEHQGYGCGEGPATAAATTRPARAVA